MPTPRPRPGAPFGGSRGGPAGEEPGWCPPRLGSRRDRRDRGRRGPDVLPGPLTPTGSPVRHGRRDRFDAIVLDVMASLEQRWGEQLARVEVAVEETPVLPPGHTGDTVPLASVVRRAETEGVRLVVFRRPIELRASTGSDLAALVLTVVVEQVSELLGLPPHEIDPRYEA